MESCNGDVGSNNSLLSDPEGPKPVGITMYNIMHPGHKRLRADLTFSNSRVGQDDTQSEQNWSAIPRHDCAALVQLNLVIHTSTVWLLQQLYIDVGMENVDMRALFGLEPTDDLKQKNELVVLHSEVKNLFQSYPHWGLIDEVIHSWYSRLPKLCGTDRDEASFEKRVWNEFYRAIHLEVTYLEGRGHLSDSKRMSIEHSLSDLCPIYHDDLSTLPSDCSGAGNDNLTSSVLGISKFSSAVPTSLPPNSILITYTDGSTRVRHELFTLLVRRGVINEDRRESFPETKSFSKRFDDEAFDVLDNLGGLEEMVPTAKSNESIKEELERKGIKSYKMIDKMLPMKLNMPLGDDEVQDLCKPPQAGKNITKEENRSSTKLEEKGIKEARLKKEIELLCELNKKEKSYLDRDTSALVMHAAELKQLVEQIKLVETDSNEIEKDISQEQKLRIEIDLYSETRRKKLLQGLSAIYPIQMLPDQFTIHGIHIPQDMHSLASSDEFISSGLGFVCHFVAMSSKYLSIPLRYRLLCNSSRSAIQNDGFDVYPLFKERVVEKEQFDFAHLLLQRNIDLLLGTRKRNVGQNFNRAPAHLLAKLDTVAK